MQVYIVDFGLATGAPNKQHARQDRNYMRSSFQGTPDYASRDSLNDVRCSAKVSENAKQLQRLQPSLIQHKLVMQDDLESLGYAFLEMLAGDLPW